MNKENKKLPKSKEEPDKMLSDLNKALAGEKVPGISKKAQKSIDTIQDLLHKAQEKYKHENRN